MNFLEILQNLGIFSIGVTGLVWLIRKIFVHFFDKDLEKFKSDLEKEAIEYKIRYERLHSERVEVIKEVYKKISNTYNSFRSLMNPWQGVEEPTQEEKGRRATENANELIYYYEQNRIFFSEELAEDVDVLLSVFKSTWNKFNDSRISNSIRDEKTSTKQWHEAWKQIEEETPKVKKQLENKFRNVLEIKNR